MTNSTIINTYTSLSGLSDITFPAKVAYAIMRNTKALEALVEDIERAQQQIYTKYGHEVPDQPGAYQIEPNNIEKANQELKDLSNVENDLKLMKISISDIGDLNLSMKDMAALYPMIQEEEG